MSKSRNIALSRGEEMERDDEEERENKEEEMCVLLLYMLWCLAGSLLACLPLHLTSAIKL